MARLTKEKICFFASILAVSSAKKSFVPRTRRSVRVPISSLLDQGTISTSLHDLECPSHLLLIRGGGQPQGGRDYDYDYGYGRGGNDRYYEGDDEPDYEYSGGYGSQGTGSGGAPEDDRYSYGSGRGYENERGYEDDYYGDERDRDHAPSKKALKSPFKSTKLPPDVGGLLRHGNKKIGMMLLGGGAVFTLLGISLFFNKTLMRLGNLLFIGGVPLFIGPGRTAGYFLQPKKARATGCLGFGVFLVMVGWPVLGIALEIFGILNLFGNMFPVFMILLKQMPVIGPMLQGDSKGKSKSQKKDYYEDSYRYEDEDDRYGNDDGYRQGDRRYYD